MSLYSTSHTDEEYNREVMEEALAIGGLAFTPGANTLGITDPNNPKHVEAFINKQRMDGTKMIRERANATTRMIGMVGSFDNSVHNLLKAGDEKVRKALIQSALDASKGVGILVDVRARNRRGADGTEKESARVVGVHCVGVLARDTANPLLHVHLNFYPFGVTDKKQINSLDTRPFHAPDHRLGVVFQHLFAAGVEKRLGYNMEIEAKHGMARVVGVTTERESHRMDDAKAYLKEKGIKPSPVAKAYALKNTRPKKQKVNLDAQFKAWNEYANKEEVKPQQVEQHKKGLFAKIVDDLIVMPVKVFVTAWKITMTPGRTLVVVNDIGEFLKDTKPPTLKQRHKAAIKAIRRTKCDSFMDALTVAEKAFKAAKPKLEIPKNAVIKVKATKIESKQEEEALQKVANKHGAELRVYGKREELKEEQTQKQKV